MALKEAFINANVLYSNNSLPSFHFFDCVDQQEWIAVRENLLDPGNVEDHRCPQSFSLLVIGEGYSGLFLYRTIEQFYTKRIRVGIVRQHRRVGVVARLLDLGTVLGIF